MREKVLSVTANDCRWEYFRGTGAGGQKRNKTSNACRCTHDPSGAVGTCEEYRSQFQNKTTAFRRMAETKEFMAWWKLEVSKKLGIDAAIKDWVEKQMRFIKVEGKENGKWVELEK